MTLCAEFTGTNLILFFSQTPALPQGLVQSSHLTYEGTGASPTEDDLDIIYALSKRINLMVSKQKSM